MNRAATVLLCAALAACTQTTAEVPSTSHINDQQAFAAARAAVLANLKDPDSAKFGTTFARKTVGGGPGAALQAVALGLMFISVDDRTDLVCGTVNSKNSFGGYAGHSVFAYRVSRKDVFIDETGPLSSTERLGSRWCVAMETAS